MSEEEEEEYKEDLDFEIKFYEGVLKKKPEFLQALIALGDLYTRKGLYEEGLVIDERLSKLKPQDAVVLYNLACSYSLTNNVDESFRIMKKAIACGYDDFRHLDRDDDLVNLRNDRRFQKFYISLKTKYEANDSKEVK